MVPPGPVERAIFGGSTDTPGGYLLYIDMREAVFVDVLLDGEGDGCEGYGFAEEPGYALLCEGRGK